MEHSRQPSVQSFNPVAFVCIRREKPGLKRLVVVADHARDVASVGMAAVDVYSFFNYAQIAKGAMGMP